MGGQSRKTVPHGHVDKRIYSSTIGQFPRPEQHHRQHRRRIDDVELYEETIDRRHKSEHNMITFSERSTRPYMTINNTNPVYTVRVGYDFYGRHVSVFDVHRERRRLQPGEQEIEKTRTGAGVFE